MEWKRGILRIGREEKVWFTADTHIGHRNIIRYCKRPFACVEEMNEALILVTSLSVVLQNGLLCLTD